MSDDQFSKLFQYMEKRFDQMDKRFEDNTNDHADIRGAITELSAQVKSYMKKCFF